MSLLPGKSKANLDLWLTLEEPGFPCFSRVGPIRESKALYGPEWGGHLHYNSKIKSGSEKTRPGNLLKNLVVKMVIR